MRSGSRRVPLDESPGISSAGAGGRSEKEASDPSVVLTSQKAASEEVGLGARENPGWGA